MFVIDKNRLSHICKAVLKEQVAISPHVMAAMEMLCDKSVDHMTTMVDDDDHSEGNYYSVGGVSVGSEGIDWSAAGSSGSGRSNASSTFDLYNNFQQLQFDRLWI